MDDEARFSDQIRLAITVADATWCAGLHLQNGGWGLVSFWGGGTEEEIGEILSGATARWLSGAAESGRMRSRVLKARNKARRARRVTVFPAPGGQNVLVVESGNERIETVDQALFKALSRRIESRIPANRPERALDDEDARLLNLLASQISISIRNARLFQELGERIKTQKAAENKMIEAARLAAIGEMAASIAHELNNPLTAITGFSELLLDEFPEGSRQRENMALVLQEARRARAVVRRLLDFSRREKDWNGPVEITEAVSEALTLLQPMAQMQGVEIQFEAWDDLPQILGDRSQLRQVLLNLVTNAIQSMPRGGKLQVQTSMAGHPREMVSIRVRDEGVGIPAEYLNQIFDPFFTTKPVGSGTGLGLSISKNIILKHGGEILVESREGEGACFTVLLPVLQTGERGAD